MQLLPLAQSAYARAEQILYKIKTSKYGYDQKHVGNGPGNLVVAKKNNKRNKDKIGIPELKLGVSTWHHYDSAHVSN